MYVYMYMQSIPVELHNCLTVIVIIIGHSIICMGEG